MSFSPDYTRIEKASRNIDCGFAPLYDHLIDGSIVGKIMNTENIWDIGSNGDHDCSYKIYGDFLIKMGYDVMIQEYCLTTALIDGGALGNHKQGAIRDMKDFEKYPWDEIPTRYFDMFNKSAKAMRANMPAGMKAIGGVGNGVFEVVQDLVGYMDLCYISADDPELYGMLFVKIGDMMADIWTRFMAEYGDMYCVMRFGDDLGYKMQTLLPEDDVKKHIIPQYKRLIDIVHSHNKPFLLHSCGCIFNVMDDLIDIAGIDAKHSNEDAIAPFSKWVIDYGTRIGNFGGIDTDIICHDDEKAITEYVGDVYKATVGKGGVAYGTGNSVPDYVNVEGYLAMNTALRKCRGEF